VEEGFSNEKPPSKRLGTNVVFTAPGKNRQGLLKRLEEAVADRFAFQVSLVLRDQQALRGLEEGNPFIRGANAERIYVGFLRDMPAKRLPPDLPLGQGEEVRLVDGDIFLHLPGGVGKTKLTNALFDRLCGTVCTIRNWNTVLALLDFATRK